MKKLYVLIATVLLWAVVSGQTNPAAQAIPYNQDFSSLTHTSSTYPAGWQGWQQTGTTLSSSFDANAPAADKALVASGSASSATGASYNYDGKIGFLNSGSSGNQSLVVALNTTGASNIEVVYDIMTIRNPHNGTTNTRINEVTLQYRIGASGNFTTLTGIEYQNNTTTQTGSGVTTPQNPQSKSLTLPSDCNNQSVVQLRWISREVSGAGSRPSFAVDNITVEESDAKAVTLAVITNAAEASSPTAGSFSLTLDPATTASTTVDYELTGTAAFNTDYSVTLSGGASPSPLTSNSGTITIPSGQTSITISVTPIDDNSPEGPEIVTLTLSNASDDYEIASGAQSLTIVDDDPTFIHTIQGSGTSATPGACLVEAIVTGIYPTLSPGGFYIQEEDADADNNPNTSEGIFVVSAASVNISDKVRVNGTVQENGSTPSFGQAVIHTTSTSIVNTGNAMPTVSNITLPVNAIEMYEKYEGMIVHFTNELTVTDIFNLGRFGEINLSHGGLVYQPTQFVDPNDDPASGTTSSGATNVAPVNALTLDNALKTILLDDGRGTIPSLPFVNSDNTLRIGSTTEDLTGILGFGFSRYRVQPIPSTPPAFDYDERPELPSVGEYNVKIASFNVLNYFNGDGVGGGFPTARGAHSAAEFTRQRDKIINAIATIDADILGLIEMENDGTGSTSAIQDLVNGLNDEIGAGTYDFVFDGASSQAFCTDAIRCAFIYKPSVVSPQGAAMISSNSVFNRPPLAQTFTLLSTCSDFNVIINHFKSKTCTGSSGQDEDQLDGQACYNLARKLQAEALVDFIGNTIIPTSGTDRILTMGDYNAYFEEDPMDILRGEGYTVLGSGEGFSFLFNGLLGSLDHAVVSGTLATYVSGVEKWHLNASEPPYLDYNDGINDGGGDFVNQWASTYTDSPFRSSDHDPIIIGLNLPDELPTASITVEPENNIYTGGIATNIYLGYGPQAATLNTETEGGDNFTYAWTPATGLSCTDCQDPVFTPASAGSYEYTLTATSDKGCIATANVSLCVKDVRAPRNKIYLCHNGRTLEIAASAIPEHLLDHADDQLGNCEDAACGAANKIALKIEENNTMINVYPNPVSDKLFVELPTEAEAANVWLIDIAGNTIESRLAVKGLIQFSLDNLANGSYMVRVQYGNSLYSTKVILH